METKPKIRIRKIIRNDKLRRVEGWLEKKLIVELRHFNGKWLITKCLTLSSNPQIAANRIMCIYQAIKAAEGENNLELTIY